MAASSPSAGVFSSARVRVAGLLFGMVVINYMDRGNLAVAATGFGRDLGFDAVHLGLIFSGFGWAYAALQIPGGWLVDRVPPRLLYGCLCALWSVATLCQGLAGSFAALFALRLVVGMFEAPAFPTCNRVVTTWFPEGERATAIGCYTSGQFVSLAFFTSLLLFAQKVYGWRFVFTATGALGLAWSLVWMIFYRDPLASRTVSRAEIDHIRAGGALVDLETTDRHSGSRLRWADLALVLSSRKLWGIYLGQYALTSIQWFFLTWFPTYLVKYRHIDFIKAGYVASLPYLAAFAGVLCSGLFSDLLVRRGVAPATARKIPIISGLLASAAIVGANYVTGRGPIIFFMTVAMFGNGFASIAWVLVSLAAPKRLIGLTGGVFNFIGQLSSFTVPAAIGFLVRGTDFTPALSFVGGLALCGALSYILLVGKIERIPDPPPTAA
jgi:ACS family D-galactonate transporter-like MFS transporter